MTPWEWTELIFELALAAWAFCALLVLAIFAACAVAGALLKDHIKALTDLSEPVPDSPEEAS